MATTTDLLPFDNPKYLQPVIRAMMKAAGFDWDPTKAYPRNTARFRKDRLRAWVFPDPQDILCISILTMKGTPLMTISFGGDLVKWKLEGRFKAAMMEIPTDPSFVDAMVMYVKMVSAGNTYMRGHPDIYPLGDGDLEAKLKAISKRKAP